MTPKESTVSSLGVEALRPTNPLITDLSMLILVQFVPPKVTTSESQLVLQETMEENVVTLFGSPHTLISATTMGGMLPPNPPSSA